MLAVVAVFGATGAVIVPVPGGVSGILNRTRFATPLTVWINASSLPPSEKIGDRATVPPVLYAQSVSGTGAPHPVV